MNRQMKPIAMKCSEEQFNVIKPILEENGVQIENISSFLSYCYLINNALTQLGLVTNVWETAKSSYNRVVFEEWNQNTFLEYCGIKSNK